MSTGQGPVRDLEVAAEVRALVPAESLEQVRERARSGYECALCDGKSLGLAADPAAVLILTDEVTSVLKLAHAVCSPSRVVRLARGVLLDGMGPEDPAHAMAAWLPAVPDDRPVLVVELPAVDTGEGVESRDELMAVAMRRGLQLVTRLGRALPAVEGWTVELHGPGVLTLWWDVDAEPVYAGSCPRPAGWDREVAEQGGRVEVFIGSGLDLAGASDYGGVAQRLRAAAGRAHLAGGRIAVRGLR